MRLRDQPHPKKITFVIMGITAVVLLLAFGALFYFQACILRQQATHDCRWSVRSPLASVALLFRFKDEDAASQILNRLKGMPRSRARAWSSTIDIDWHFSERRVTKPKSKRRD